MGRTRKLYEVRDSQLRLPRVTGLLLSREALTLPEGCLIKHYESAVAELPFDLDRYFVRTPGSFEIPLESLTPTRARPSGISSAADRMLLAYKGELAPRQPIKVRRIGGERFEILDGNSTFAVALESNWPAILAEEEAA